MTFEVITHFLSKEPRKTNQVPKEQPINLQEINLLPLSINPDRTRAMRNKFAKLSIEQKKAA